MAKEKKIDIKKVKKGETVQTIVEHFEDLGFQVSNGKAYGLTDTTLIIHLEECDIQIKVIAPGAKNGLRYQIPTE